MSKDIETIKNIQRLLYDFNIYKGKIDGIFSDKTEESVKIFQKYYKQYEHIKKHKYKVPLIIDGKVGKETILAMDEAAVNDWIYIKPKEDILYDTENNSLLLLTTNIVEEFYEEESLLNDSLASIEQLRKSENITEDEIKETKETTAKTFKEIEIDNIKSTDLTEFRRLSGQKFTYIRSKKIKNHWRKYSLDVDDRKRQIEGKEKVNSINELMTEGKFDKKKIKNAFTSKFKDTKVKIFEWNILDDNEVLINASNWINTISGNFSKGTEIYDKNGKEIQRNFDSNIDARWLRFSAGMSLNCTPKIEDILKGKLALNFNAQAQYALAKSEFETKAYIPNSTGWNPTISNYTKTGLANGEIDMGYLRFIILGNLQGFAGVNAIIGANVGFDLDKTQGKISLATKDVIIPKLKETQAKTEIDLFAGIKATCEAAGQFEWRSPEKNMEFTTIAKVSYGGSVAIGAGAEGEFKLDFQRGKFIIRARAGIVCGVGFSGEVGFEVGTDTILNLVEFVYQTLRQMDYTYLDIFTKEAFEAVTMLMIKVVNEGLDKIEKIYNELEIIYMDFWEQYFSNLENERALAKEIIRGVHDDMIKYTTPEAKGSLIAYLSKTSLFRTEETQEMAINYILNYCQSKNEALNVFENVTMNSSKVSSQEGKEKILAILDNYSIRSKNFNFGYHGKEVFDEWWEKLPQKPIGKYKNIVAMSNSIYFIDENIDIAYA